MLLQFSRRWIVEVARCMLDHLWTVPEVTNDGIVALAMTANSFDQDRQICLAAGMDDPLPKPIVLDRLFSALSRWLPPTDTLKDRSQS